MVALSVYRIFTREKNTTQGEMIVSVLISRRHSSFKYDTIRPLTVNVS